MCFSSTICKQENEVSWKRKLTTTPTTNTVSFSIEMVLLAYNALHINTNFNTVWDIETLLPALNPVLVCYNMRTVLFLHICSSSACKKFYEIGLPDLIVGAPPTSCAAWIYDYVHDYMLSETVLKCCKIMRLQCICFCSEHCHST